MILSYLSVTASKTLLRSEESTGTGRDVAIFGTPQKAKKWAETHFSAPEAAFFAALCRARGSAPPRRAAAAYGVAYLSTKCLGEVKSSSGRAAMFVAAKTFFVRNLEIGPEI